MGDTRSSLRRASRETDRRMIFTEDQQALKEAARKFSRERLSPKYQQRERERGSIATWSARWIARPDRHGPARALRRHGRRRRDHRRDHRGTVLRRFQCRRAGRGSVALRRHRREERVRADPVIVVGAGDAGRGDPRSFDHRTARRLGRRRPAVEGSSRRRRLSALWRKDLHDLLGQRRRLPRLRPNRTRKRCRKGCDGFSCSRCGRRPDVDALSRRRQPYVGARIALLRRGSCSGRQPTRRRRPRLLRGHGRVRLFPSADRAAMHRRSAGLDRRGLGLYQRARSLRRPHRPVPGRDLSPGRGRDPTRCGSPARLPHVGASRRGPAAYGRGRHD